MQNVLHLLVVRGKLSSSSSSSSTERSVGGAFLSCDDSSGEDQAEGSKRH
jgi:hypothetical protein